MKYQNVSEASGKKLASSAIDPLVALSRGYRRVENAGELDISASQKRQAKKMGGAGPVMVMPWHRIDEVASSASRLEVAKESCIQMRPENPVVGTGGKVVKYLNLKGEKMPLDIHPATPIENIKNPDIIYITEGLLKADALLSNILKENEINTETKKDDDKTSATVRLRKALESLGFRPLIISIVGVANWRGPGIETLAIRGKKVVIAFDADIASNFNVWTQADKLSRFLIDDKQVSSVKFLTLAGEEEKTGLDDFFASGGTYSELEENLSDLPPRPKADLTPDVDGEIELKRWYISKDGTAALTYVPPNGESGFDGDWMKVCDLGGRIKSIFTSRCPEDREIESGKSRPLGDKDPYQVEVEVSYRTGDGKVVTGVIAGSSQMLDTPPNRWRKECNASIPASISLHPQWPPKEGDLWLRAVKSHRWQEIEKKVVYEVMGYRPGSGNGAPDFLVGTQKISPDGVEEIADPPVTEEMLKGSYSFGVSELGAFGTEEWKGQVREALGLMTKALYFGAYRGGGNLQHARSIADIVVGASLFNTLPIPSRLSTMLIGAPGTGKSWTASQMMNFWTSPDSCWTNNHLPGNAGDTSAATEIALASPPIWCVDDLAPSSSKRASDSAKEAVANAIRAIHNRTGKRRSNPQLTSANVRVPNAVLVVTGENPLQGESIRQRTIEIFFSKDKDDPTRNTLGKNEDVMFAEDVAEDGYYSLITCAMIQYVQHLGIQMGWENLTKSLKKSLDKKTASLQDLARTRGEDAGSFKRRAEICSQVVLALSVLRSLGEYVGAEDEYWSEIFTDKKSYQIEVNERVLALFYASSSEVEESGLGEQALSVLSGKLLSGAVHLRSAFDSSAPYGQPAIDSMIGWAKGDGTSPNSPCIGYALNTEPDGTGARVAIINTQSAYKEIKGDIELHGFSRSGLWNAMWTEGIAQKGVGTPRRKTTVQVRRTSADGQSIAICGVPILLDKLIGNGGDDGSD